MNPAQQKSILTVSLLAAIADGAKSDGERVDLDAAVRGLWIA